jgi:membrane associated rhomboid family serine protease
MAFEDLHRPLGAAGFRGATRWILIISGVLLLLEQFAGQYIVPVLGLVPVFVLQKHWLWQPFTYLFVHANLFHWLLNMFGLWMFGRHLEERWGSLEFVKYFFLTGVGAALLLLLLAPHSFGCSGAIFGIVVAFAMIAPEATMYLYLVIPVKAWQAAALFGIIELFAVRAGGANGVAALAHLGGMVTGYLYLRFGWQVGSLIRRPWRRVAGKLTSLPAKRRSSVELHELTDDLESHVDRILEKVSKQGAESLTPEERRIMDRYSRRNR